jgi:integrase
MVTTHEAITLYLSARAGEVAPKTLQQMRGTLTKLPDIPLAEHTEASLRAWRTGQLEAGIDPDSINTYFKRIRPFLRYARRHGWIDTDPAADIPPVVPNPKRKIRLSAAQMTAMIEGARHPRDRAIMAAESEWLLRAGELARIRLADLRLPDGMCDVTIEKKRGVFVHDEMPVTHHLAGELRSWLAAYAASIGGVLRPEYFLFPRVDTRYGNGRRAHWVAPAEPIAHPEAVIKLALDAIGIEAPRRGVHDVRRSMARLRYDALCEAEEPDPIGVIKALLHHETRRQTEQYIGIDGARTRRNKVMRGDTWLSVIPDTSTPDEAAPSGLAQVIPLWG